MVNPEVERNMSPLNDVRGQVFSLTFSGNEDIVVGAFNYFSIGLILSGAYILDCVSVSLFYDPQ